MKSIILLLFLLLLSQLSCCQSTFHITYNHSVSIFILQDHVYSVLIDSNQNILASGNTIDYVQQTSSYSILKTNNDGNLLWYKLYAYAPTSNNVIASLLFPNGNYVIAGNILFLKR